MSYRISERRACRVTRLHRGTYRYSSHKNRWTALRMRIREIAQTRVRYGYRKIRVLLNREGWGVGKTLVQRLYQEEGLALKQRPKRRRRAAEQRGERVRATEANQAWSLDFVADQLTDGRRFRALTIVDVFTRESLAIEVGQALKGTDVVEVLNRLRFERRAPKMLFCDNGSEFTSQIMDLWAYQNGVKIDFSTTRETNRQRVRGIVQRDVASGVLGHPLVRDPGGGEREHRGLATENIMRAVLTGLSGRGRRTNSPMESRLAAIPLGYKQPKTRLRVGTKKPVRSRCLNIALKLDQVSRLRVGAALRARGASHGGASLHFQLDASTEGSRIPNL